MAATTKTRIAMVVYDGFDILDHSGPYGMFSAQSSMGLDPIVVAVTKEPVACSQGMKVIPDATLKDLNGAEVVWVPGGSGDGYMKQIQHNNPLLKWLHEQKNTAKMLCSVCTGAHIAAAAGLLEGYTVTTHWLFQPQLKLFPGITLAPGFPRYWMDRNRVTGGGVSSGLDESLAVISMLVGAEAAMEAQLINQYAPDPPFNTGTPLTTPPNVLSAFYTWLGDTTQPQFTKTVEDYLHHR